MAPDELDRLYFYDEVAAEAAVAFFKTFLKLTKGEWLGRSFILEKWQADCVRQVFGWKRRVDGTRRYRTVYIWVPRKNGKTELAAGLAIMLTVADGEGGPEVYSIATDKDQAKIVFDKAVQMVSGSEELLRELTCFKQHIWCNALGGGFRPMSGIPKGKHGYNVSGLIGDEIHEWKDDKLYNFLHQSQGSRRQPLEVLISTAGERQGYGWETFQRCVNILDGTIDDPETLVIMYGADPDDDWQDPATWAKANPNLGVSIKLDYLAREAKNAKDSPRLENNFRRYHLNQWTEQAVRWLPMSAWHACGHLDPEVLARLAGEGARVASPAAPHIGKAAVAMNDRWKFLREQMQGRWGTCGVDMSAVKDLSCLSFNFPTITGDSIDDNGMWTVVPVFFCPEKSIETRSRVDKVDYEKWVKMGALIATPGDAVDQRYVKNKLFVECEFFNIKKIGIDRWNSSQMTIELNEHGLDAVLVGQGFASLSAPAKDLERRVIQNLLDHGGHPVLTWCARNVAVEQDSQENIKPSKKHSTERIDGISATVTGMRAAMETPVEPNLDNFFNRPAMAA